MRCAGTTTKAGLLQSRPTERHKPCDASPGCVASVPGARRFNWTGTRLVFCHRGTSRRSAAWGMIQSCCNHCSTASARASDSMAQM